MKEYLRYTAASGRDVYIEIDSPIEVSGVQKTAAGGGHFRIREASDRLGEGMGVISDVIDSITTSIVDTRDGINEVEVTFGVKASAEFSALIVGKAGGEATYNIKVVWKRPESIGK